MSDDSVEVLAKSIAEIDAEIEQNRRRIQELTYNRHGLVTEFKARVAELLEQLDLQIASVTENPR